MNTQQMNKFPEIESAAMIRTSIGNLAKKSFEKEIDELSNEELQFILDLDCNFKLTEFTISASETRQVRQYESNNYFASIKFDISPIYDIIVKLALMGSTHNEIIERYIKYKIAFMNSIELKYASSEDFLRHMIKDKKLKHGIQS